MAKPEKTRHSIAVGWWIVWVVTFIASLLPPVIHRWRNIADIIEHLRYPWGLLPAELLFLRHLGELSHWIPVLLIGLLLLAIKKKQAQRPLIAIGAVITAIFSSIYVAYCLIVLSMYLDGYTDAIREIEEANQGITSDR